MTAKTLETYIVEEFGERCPDYAEYCAVCEVWEAFDALILRLGTLSEDEADMAMHWLDRYGAGIDDYPQLDRIGGDD